MQNATFEAYFQKSMSLQLDFSFELDVCCHSVYAHLQFLWPSKENKWNSAGLCLGTMSGFFHICRNKLSTGITELSGNRHGLLAKPSIRQRRNQFSKVSLFNEVHLITTKLVGKQVNLYHWAIFWSHVNIEINNKEQYCGNMSLVFYTQCKEDRTSVKYAMTDLSNLGNFIDRLLRYLLWLKYTRFRRPKINYVELWKH